MASAPSCIQANAVNTTYNDDPRSYLFSGIFFTVKNKAEAIVIDTLELDVRLLAAFGGGLDLGVEVYSVLGSFQAITSTPDAWARVASTKSVQVPEGGVLIPTQDFTSIDMSAGEVRSFYVTANAAILDSRSYGLDKSGELDGDLGPFTLYTGAGTQSKFASSLDKTIAPKFSGVFHYSKAGVCDNVLAQTTVEYRFDVEGSVPFGFGDPLAPVAQSYIDAELSEGVLAEFATEFYLQRTEIPYTLTSAQSDTCPESFGTCYGASISVMFDHSSALSTGEILHALYGDVLSLSQSIQGTLGVAVSYSGESIFESTFELVFEGVQSNSRMSPQQRSYFENSFKDFFNADTRFKVFAVDVQEEKLLGQNMVGVSGTISGSSANGGSSAVTATMNLMLNQAQSLPTTLWLGVLRSSTMNKDDSMFYGSISSISGTLEPVDTIDPTFPPSPAPTKQEKTPINIGNTVGKGLDHVKDAAADAEFETWFVVGCIACAMFVIGAIIVVLCRLFSQRQMRRRPRDSERVNGDASLATRSTSEDKLDSTRISSEPRRSPSFVHKSASMRILSEPQPAPGFAQRSESFRIRSQPQTTPSFAQRSESYRPRNEFPNSLAGPKSRAQRSHSFNVPISKSHPSPLHNSFSLFSGSEQDANAHIIPGARSFAGQKPGSHADSFRVPQARQQHPLASPQRTMCRQDSLRVAPQSPSKNPHSERNLRLKQHHLVSPQRPQSSKPILRVQSSRSSDPNKLSGPIASRSSDNLCASPARAPMQRSASLDFSRVQGRVPSSSPAQTLGPTSVRPRGLSDSFGSVNSTGSRPSRPQPQQSPGWGLSRAPQSLSRNLASGGSLRQKQHPLVSPQRSQSSKPILRVQSSRRFDSKKLPSPGGPHVSNNVCSRPSHAPMQRSASLDFSRAQNMVPSSSPAHPQGSTTVKARGVSDSFGSVNSDGSRSSRLRPQRSPSWGLSRAPQSPFKHPPSNFGVNRQQKHHPLVSPQRSQSSRPILRVQNPRRVEAKRPPGPNMPHASTSVCSRSSRAPMQRSASLDFSRTQSKVPSSSPANPPGSTTVTARGLSDSFGSVNSDGARPSRPRPQRSPSWALSRAHQSPFKHPPSNSGVNRQQKHHPLVSPQRSQSSKPILRVQNPRMVEAKSPPGPNVSHASTTTLCSRPAASPMQRSASLNFSQASSKASPSPPVERLGPISVTSRGLSDSFGSANSSGPPSAQATPQRSSNRELSRAPQSPTKDSHRSVKKRSGNLSLNQHATPTTVRQKLATTQSISNSLGSSTPKAGSIPTQRLATQNLSHAPAPPGRSIAPVNQQLRPSPTKCQSSPAMGLASGAAKKTNLDVQTQGYRPNSPHRRVDSRLPIRQPSTPGRISHQIRKPEMSPMRRPQSPQRQITQSTLRQQQPKFSNDIANGKKSNETTDLIPTTAPRSPQKHNIRIQTAQRR